MTAAYINEQFAREIAQHEMKIIRNDDVHRHIRFSRPGTSCMHFDLITWPGYLCYTGDMGTYVFSRLADMFQFFRRSKRDYAIDHRYWAEKVEAADRSDGLRKFSVEKFQAYVNTWIDEREADEKPDAEDEPEEFAKHAAAFAELRAAVREDVLSADDNDVRCYDAMNNFRHEGDAWRALYGDKADFEFYDAWDGWDCSTHEYTHRFLWCCEALAWAIAKYDVETAPAAAEVPA